MGQTQLKSTVILGASDVAMIMTALHNRMTHHGRAEARLKTGPGGWHHTLCERYRALGMLMRDCESVMVIASDGVGLPPETDLPEPEPDIPDEFVPDDSMGFVGIDSGS